MRCKIGHDVLKVKQLSELVERLSELVPTPVVHVPHAFRQSLLHVIPLVPHIVEVLKYQPSKDILSLIVRSELLKQVILVISLLKFQVHEVNEVVE
jgi:hypothetical protein